MPPDPPPSLGDAVTRDLPAASVGDAVTLTHGPDARPSQTSPTVAPPGYAIEAELGRGGMGVVYRVRQVALNRTVALKMILSGDHANDRERARFLAEAEAVAAIRHPHVVQVYDLGEHAGRPFLALEYLDGGTLADRLRDCRPDPRESAALVAKLADAVQAAHDQGIVHRDLKPANVLIGADGEPRVTDFGLAKRGGTDTTRTGAVMGTPSYMSPEQARGDTKFVGPAADTYALGVILFECLTGRVPFAADDTIGLLLKVANDPAPPVRRFAPGVPRDLELVAAKCLAKEPHERYATAAALADDLRAFLAGKPIAARPAPAWERAWKWTRRNKGVAAAAAAILTVFAAGAAVSTYYALAATAEADRADAAATAARDEADRAKRQEERAETNRAAAEAAEAGQKRASRRLLLANARGELQRDDPGGALPWLALAGRTGRDEQFAALLAGFPRLVLFGRHPSGVTALAVAGGRFASGSNDGTVRVWDVAAAGPVGPGVRFPGPAYGVALSADGREVAAGGGTLLMAGKVARYTVGDGRPIGEPVELPGTPMFVAFAPGGHLVTGEYGFEGGLLSMLRGVQGRPLVTLRRFAPPVRRTPPGVEMPASGAPGARTLADPVAANRGWAIERGESSARVIDLSTRRPVGPFVHRGPMSYSGFSGERFVVITDTAANATVWDLDAGTEHRVPLGYYWTVRAAAVDERRQLAVAFYDGFVQRYELATGRPIPESGKAVGHPGWDPQFSPDGAHLASARGDILRAWRTDDLSPICPPLRHGAAVTAVAFLAEGRQLAVGAGDGTVRVWDVAPAERPAFRVQTNLPADDLRFAADGRFVLTGGGGQWREHPDKLAGQRYAVVTTDLVPDAAATAVAADGDRVFVGTDAAAVRFGKATLTHANKFVRRLLPTPDGRLLVTRDATADIPPGEFMGGLNVWDVDAGRHLFPPLQSNFEVGAMTDVAVHAGTNRLAVARGFLDPAGIRGHVELRDLATGEPVGRPFPLPPQMIAGRLRFSPDGRLLAVGAVTFPRGGGEVAVRDTSTGAAVVPPVRVASRPESLDFSPDGRRLAAAVGPAVFLIDTTRADPPAELPHPKNVRFARFERGGAWLLTAAEESVHVWDVDALDLVRPPLRHETWVAAAAVSPDARHVVAAGGNKTLMGWAVSSADRDPAAAARLSRLLSAVHVDGDKSARATAEQLADDWAALARDHPGEVRVPADVTAEWHNRECNAALNALRFGAAARHLEATWPVYVNAHNRRMTGACYLKAGDPAGVRRAFAELSRMAADPAADSDTLRAAVEIGLHNPDALPPADRARAVELVEKLREAVKGKGTVYDALAVGLAYTRAGRLDEAERYITLVRGNRPAMALARADAQLAALRRLEGRADEAVALADKAATTIAPHEGPRLTNEWLDAILVRRLIDEARRPLRETTPPPRESR